jgi:hypothetical protein
MNLLEPSTTSNAAHSTLISFDTAFLQSPTFLTVTYFQNLPQQASEPSPWWQTERENNW